ncbi:MAG: tryptophan--tRNA ligase [Candidatus Parcubacteria bacterium]|nr:MAG: tryptophan--tRNA ligase [Candidatus Parcubacteria bacterium]
MKRILTGIKPTGKLHLGNYLSVIRELIEMQNRYQVLLMIANLHAQTVPYSTRELSFLTYDIVKSLIALGINPKKTIIFKQSDIPAHLYLFWFLSTVASVGELMRMHEFKEQSEKYKKTGVGSGILLYPVLMSADILIYNVDLVPVGEDQKQHLELCRELVRKFNKRFNTKLKIPKAYIPNETAKIMSLINPSKKMSKSEPEGCLEIFAPEKEIKQKILKAITDSDNEVKFDPSHKPGISNLMTIYKYLTKKTYSEIENNFKNKGYYEFKLEIYNSFMSYFKKARLAKNKITNQEINKIFKQSAIKLNKIANNNLNLIMSKLGLN